MRKTERKIAALLKEHLPKDCWIFGVENGALVGTPDLYLQTPIGALWIELKCPRIPARAETPLFKNNHGISAAQIDFGRKVARAGGRSMLLICTDCAWIGVDGIDLSREFCDTATFEQWLKIAVFDLPAPHSETGFDNLYFGLMDFAKNGDTGLPFAFAPEASEPPATPPAFLRKDADRGI